MCIAFILVDLICIISVLLERLKRLFPRFVFWLVRMCLLKPEPEAIVFGTIHKTIPVVVDIVGCKTDRFIF